MSEYWKSNPKHHCDYCDCWIADNKPSRDFHEKGKRHQENVKKKIDEVRKKGIANAKKEEADKNAFKKMEAEAMKAFKNDLINDPVLAAQYGIRIVQGPQKPPSASSASSSGSLESKSGRPQTSGSRRELNKPRPKKQDVKPEVKPAAQVEKDNSHIEWFEETTPEGYTYYWNEQNRIPQWEKPEGYISKAEQHEKGDDVHKQNEVKEDNVDETEDGHRAEECAAEEIPLPGEENKEKVEIQVTGVKRKQESDETESVQEKTIGSQSVQQNTVGSQSVQQNTVGPMRKPEVYGSWQSVPEKKPKEKVDLQLPKVSDNSSKEKPAFTLPEAKIKFRQKTVSTIGSEFEAFKKRKMASGNIRKRTG